MNSIVGLLLCLAACSVATSVQAEEIPSHYSATMRFHGQAIAENSNIGDGSGYEIQQFSSNFPTQQLSKIVKEPVLDAGGHTRSAKDAAIYRAVAPSVVLIVTKEGFGSGSLMDTNGSILTNWHVVSGYDYVAVIFKPLIEGKEPTRDEVKRGQVIKYDEVADLALLTVPERPAGRTPIRLGDSSEVAVGMDVHAIGHPTGEAWTYTTGVISQYRRGYEWQSEGDPVKHKADIIQTQTPISPGSSGGPLLSDSSNLIGINSFKAKGEALNFAISVDDIRRFIVRTESRVAQTAKSSKDGGQCQPKILDKFRDEAAAANVVSFDMFCTGKDTGELVTPDDTSQAIFLRLDRNGDGQADAIIFDLKRQGRWNLSFWDENFKGHWTLVGYHDDGSLKPTRFESYDQFQKRMAER